MRILFALLATLFTLHATTASAASQSALRDRCTAAIAASGQGVDAGKLKQSMAVSLGESGFLFQFADKVGGTFTCQICDDANPAVHGCGSIGLDLSYRPKAGEMQKLPAELDKKCSYFLQKEVRPPGDAPFVDLAIVKRIHTTAEHTDTRWVYNMELDGNPYRCVIRKSDGSFRLESRKGGDWRPIANGVLF